LGGSRVAPEDEFHPMAEAVNQTDEQTGSAPGDIFDVPSGDEIPL